MFLRSKITERYNNLWNEALNNFTIGACRVDGLMDDCADTRRGVTLLFRPSSEVKKQIQLFLSKLNKIEPGQYFYPDTDIHVTVASIISAHQNFSLKQIDPVQYVSVIKKSLAGIKPFKVEFTGVTADPSCMIIQGYPLDDQLQYLRSRLKKNFHESGLLQSIDTRYSLITSHSTVARFRKPITNSEKLLHLLEEYREHEFGISEVKEVEFVFNDWYQRKALSPTLASFQLVKADVT